MRRTINHAKKLYFYTQFEKHKGNVKPLYKKGDNFCLNNYKSISLLPTISKTFELIMFTQLYYYLNANNL